MPHPDPRLFAFLPLLLTVPSGAWAAADASSVDGVVAQARRLGLAHERQWLKLGHWQPTLLGGFKSQADGMDFFLAPDGKRSPEAELEATLRALFGQLQRTPDQVARKIQPALCRFPARAAWLVGKLQLDPSVLAAQECPELDDFWRHVQPFSATIVFSSYYMNNPASSFGHTFLRIRKTGDGISADKCELLDYGIDYAAAADTTNPVLYAFKGIFGLFPGFFHIFPYYLKVREYNDVESRDLWEYDLSLAPAQVAMLVAHVYELGSTYFDYYYLDENCSYHVLAALEAAAPDLHLTDQLKLPVVPADTVKALQANPGLVVRTTYRPSAATQFHARIAGMTSTQLAAVEGLARDPEAPLPAGSPQAERIRLFDAAADLIDVRYAKELPFEPDGPAGKLKRRVLERRAEILQPSPELRIPPPLHKRPDAGHGSARISAGPIWSSVDGPMVSASWRISLHDLSDPPDGYPELSQIQFLPLQIRANGNSLALESLDLLDAISLHAVSAFDHAISWRIRAGVRRLRDHGCAGCLTAGAEFGSGFTVATDEQGLALFLLADMGIDAASDLRGISGVPGLRAGLGPLAGARARFGESGVLLLSGTWRYYPGALVTTSWQVDASLRWAANPGVAVGIEGRKTVLDWQGGGGLYFYF